ncbi:MAG: hypothetical protein HYU70_05165 [Bacteroidetes bacterium]|nr:hypothetical protein [Bacteroidota bacterium]
MPEKIEENTMSDSTLKSSSQRSEAMNELLSRKTGFLTKWALLIFLIILALTAAATWFIRYPDIVLARATIVAGNVPKEIVTRENGRLIRLFVKTGQHITSGTIIGYTESNASHQQVIALAAQLDSTLHVLQVNDTTNIMSRFKQPVDSLGELQLGYQQFITASQLFADYIGNGYYIQKHKMLLGDLVYLKDTKDNLQQQKMLLQKDLQLSEESFAVSERLLKEKVLSKQDERIERSKLLSKQLTIPQINAVLLTNETQQREKNKEIQELDHIITQQKITFQQQAMTLQSAVQDWMKRYIIKASTTGNINFLFPLQEDNYFPANKLLGYINPAEAGYYAEANLQQVNFGKVQKGQRVQLRFDAYPYTEFGFVNGKLDFIAGFATDSGFLAHIQLPEGLFTSQHKQILYHNGLKAEARIVTKDMRLLDRFLYNIRSLIQQ